MICMIFPKDPKQLRKFVIEERKKKSEEERIISFQKILSNLYSLPEFQSATHILGYFGLTSSGEFDTRPLLNRILASEKHLYLPKCALDQIHLDLFQVHNLQTGIEKGAYSIMEPVSNPKNEANSDQMDVILVPGSVFDVFGHRYGFGKGYYDSLLRNYAGCKIAFSYSFAVMNFPLIVHSKDIPMSIIITPEEIFRL
jgi:5-formyltetrahydrofolate cyclo-ligase